MFIPVGPDGGEQDVWTVDKDAQGKVTKTKLFGVRVRAHFRFPTVSVPNRFSAGFPPLGFRSVPYCEISGG